jgi:hypothetical protein
LAVEGRSEGRTYYRRANVGASEDGSPAQPLRETWSPFLFPLDDLPVAGLTDLRIGFDLMGAGDIWIDGIQLYDLWFQENERDALLKAIAVAEVQLQAGQLRDCARFLESPWPQFLLQHVPAVEQLARTAPATSTPPAEVSPTPAPTLLERVRSWSPRLPLSKKE